MKKPLKMRVVFEASKWNFTSFLTSIANKHFNHGYYGSSHL